MKYPGIMFLTLAAITGFVSCSKEPGQEPDLTPKSLTLTARGPEVIANCNDSGVELFTKVASGENENLMLSPLSASTALTMLLNGCGGDTYDQLKETLKYPADMTISEINEVYKSLTAQLLVVDPKVKLALANAIFYRQNFSVKEPFLNTMDTDFDAEIAGLDFDLRHLSQQLTNGQVIIQTGKSRKCSMKYPAMR